MPYYRSQRSKVYHNCSRCDFRYPLDEMLWQQGKLLCLAKCYDNSITGARDIQVARAVSIPRHELEPDEKLTNPSERRADVLDVYW
jgi:hypothetical protein